LAAAKPAGGIDLLPLPVAPEDPLELALRGRLGLFGAGHVGFGRDASRDPLLDPVNQVRLVLPLPAAESCAA
ncbi:MAG: hypothetical protein M3452_03280, partial [Chloroflexota bacterium]|nr:hypothetical protein [Chloroflexota bacterium]